MCWWYNGDQAFKGKKRNINAGMGGANPSSPFPVAMENQWDLPFRSIVWREVVPWTVSEGLGWERIKMLNALSELTSAATNLTAFDSVCVRLFLSLCKLLLLGKRRCVWDWSTRSSWSIYAKVMFGQGRHAECKSQKECFIFSWYTRITPTSGRKKGECVIQSIELGEEVSAHWWKSVNWYWYKNEKYSSAACQRIFLFYADRNSIQYIIEKV